MALYNTTVARGSGTASRSQDYDQDGSTRHFRSSCTIAEHYLADKKRSHDDADSASSPKRNSGAQLCFLCRKWGEDIGARHPDNDAVLCVLCCEGECVVCKTDFAFGGDLITNIWGAVVHEACMYPETPERRLELAMPMASDTTPHRVSTPPRRLASPVAPSPPTPRHDCSPVAPSPPTPRLDYSPQPPPPMSPCGASSPLPPSGTAMSVVPRSPQSVHSTPPASPQREVTPKSAPRHSDAHAQDQWHATALCIVRDSGRFNMFTEFDVARIIAAGFLALWGRSAECRAMLTEDVAKLACRFYDWCFERCETLSLPAEWTRGCLRNIDRSTPGWQRRAVDAVWAAAVDAGRNADLIHTSIAPILMHGVVALSMPTHK